VWVDRFDCENTLGECRFEYKQICLKKNQSDSEILKTLIHEMFHAMEFEYKIQLPHKAIYGLEDAVYKILKLNKWIP
jgi:hypothetical protein